MEAATLHAPSVRRPRFGRVLSDDRLVERIRAGDEGAFEVLYDRYHADLLAFCRHMLGNRDEAEDALQQVFISAYRNLPAPGRDLQLRALLDAVAINRCLSTLRSRRQAVNLDDVPEPEAAGLAIAAEVEHRQDLKDLLTDMARLPDDQRAALVLAELGSLSHDEIATALDVRTDKVKALVFQAREALVGWKQARNADCTEIREQLATLHGGALRRAPIRRHLDTCPSCLAYKDEIRQQRVALAAVLPVVPTLALKQSVLGAALASGSVAGAGAAGAGAVAGAAAAGGASTAAGGGMAAALGSGLVAKGLAVAAVAVGVTGGGYAAVHHKHSNTSSSSHGAPGPKGPTTAPASAVQPTPSGVATPLARGPVQHVPGTPVRRGPVAHSHGRGPGPAGTNRGNHNGQFGAAGTAKTNNASTQGQAHRNQGNGQSQALHGQHPQFA